MLFSDSYQTISGQGTGEYKEKGSLFMGLAFPVSGEQEIKKILTELKEQHPDANHHCYAFRLGANHESYRFTDDREPSGSAGKPIFGVIRSNDLTNVLIVVVRYFGGSLLGVPGLINSYRTAAQLAVESGGIITRPVTEKYSLIYSYDVVSEMNTLIRQSEVTVLSQMMTEKCRIDIEVVKSNAAEFLNRIKTHHKINTQCEIKVLE